MRTRRAPTRRIRPARITDLIDSCQPDLLYTDGGMPFGQVGSQLAAHFYNANINADVWTIGHRDVTGTVTDPTGASVAAAQVVLTNTDISTESTVTTNGDGRYSFVRVRPGHYKFSVTASGFSCAETPTFPVEVNQTVVCDFPLTVGQVNETISITDEAPLIDTD